MLLNLQPNITKPDDFYEELINSQRDMSDDEAQLMNSKLILLMANHIGDRNIISEAITAASK